MNEARRLDNDKAIIVTQNMIQRMEELGDDYMWQTRRENTER
jgi:hypothetical protein